jgi:TRAP-type mannitol/chloroaromatic compound transport system substrate-binding protein
LFGEERIYDKLSPDAKAVLDKATELVEKSIKMRMIMSNDENHLDSWDAGYAQLKLVWKEYFSDDFKEFRQLYKNMEDRMRPLVYELGFLMK